MSGPGAAAAIPVKAQWPDTRPGLLGPYSWLQPGAALARSARMIHGTGDITRIATIDQTTTTLRPRMSDKAKATSAAPRPMATPNSTNGPKPSQNFQNPRSGTPQRLLSSEDSDDDAASNSPIRSDRAALATPISPTTMPAAHRPRPVDFLLSGWVLGTRAVCHEGPDHPWSWPARLAHTRPSPRHYRADRGM